MVHSPTLSRFLAAWALLCVLAVVFWSVSGNDEAGQLDGLAAPPVLLAFNLAAFQSAQAFEVGHGLGKPSFLLNRF